MDWVQEVQEHLKVEGDQIAIDGKTLRGSFCKTKFVKALHTVNAFSTSTSMSLGQLNTQKKSNEITTIPFLLDLLKLKGNLVSIDAIGCQKKIAEKIVEKSSGDYLLALKKNQKGFQEATEEIFRRSGTNGKRALKSNSYEEKETSRGREVIKRCDVIHLDREVGFFPHEDWPTISSIIRVKSIREEKSKISEETRYYISSKRGVAKEMNEKIRNHWGIENKLHWSLDVTMNEDRDKKWAKESAKNFSLLRKLCFKSIKERAIGKESSKEAVISIAGQMFSFEGSISINLKEGIIFTFKDLAFSKKENGVGASFRRENGDKVFVIFVRVYYLPSFFLILQC